MKTKLHFIFFMIIGMMTTQAQNRTTVTANSVDISDNLDLRAIATIFGESATLEDFERRLNDPQMQLSNLDLNNDNEVDYLRIIESVENRTHLIIIQSIIGRDLFQDVATIEIERMQNNQLQVQLVGNSFLYGTNYIYEPIYNYSPVIYNTFWANSYHPYFSPWHWNYYPGFYYAWNPFPYFRYRNHINFYVNLNNTCHYVNHRRSNYAVVMHQNYRTNGYERMHPNRSFQNRNNGFQNRHDLVGNDNSTRGQVATNSPRPSRANSFSGNATAGTRSSVSNSSISPRPTRANSFSGNATAGTRSSVSNSSISPRPTRANSFNGTATSETRSSSSSSPISPRPTRANSFNGTAATPRTRSSAASSSISPRPTRAENPKSYTMASETFTNTPRPSQRSTKSEFIANNYPRETRSNQSMATSSNAKPSISSVRNNESSSYSSTRSNGRATQNQMETKASSSSQPRMNQSSSNRTERNNSESRIQSSSSQRTSGSSMRRG
jgi:hypothetical protein